LVEEMYKYSILDLIRAALFRGVTAFWNENELYK
jgi:hypothetical protein